MGRFLTVGLKGQHLQVVLWPGTPSKATRAPGPIPAACIIETDDRLGAFARLKSLGVTFEESEPVEAPIGRYATLVDPDGNRLSLREWRRQPNAR